MERTFKGKTNLNSSHESGRKGMKRSGRQRPTTDATADSAKPSKVGGTKFGTGGLAP